jgi:hypothetical protein
MTPEDVAAEIKRQLDWKGATGRPAGHVVIKRNDALVLIEAIKQLPKPPPEEKKE